MNGRLIRLLVAVTALVGALGASALVAGASSGQSYCDPLGGCPYVKISPSTVKAGNAITVSGTVGNGCQKPALVTILSRAFRGATRREFAGVPAIFSTTNRAGKFSKRMRIAQAIRAGHYHVGGRCGGGNFGSTTLAVTKR